MSRMKLLVIANQKGGVGKSVMAYHYAYYLAEKRNQRVLFWDFDEQGSSSRSLRVFAKELAASQFFSSVQIDAGTLPKDQIVLAMSDAGLRMVEQQKDNHAGLLENLKARIENVCNDFDWCVIDTPGSNSIIAGAALAVGDFVLVPSIVDDYSINVATKMLKRIIGVQKTLNPKLVNIGILPTLFNATAPSQKRDLELLLQKYHQYVLRAKVSNKTSYREAAAIGIPVWKMDKTSAREAAKEINEVFEIIAEKMGV